MKLVEAFDKLATEQSDYYGSPLLWAATAANAKLSAAVGSELKTVSGVEFDTFDNCREYGLTYTFGGWTFCAFEHRNSNELHIEGSPTGEIQSYGPYGGIDKWDTIAHWGPDDSWRLAETLLLVAQAAADGAELSRQYVKDVARKNAAIRH